MIGQRKIGVLMGGLSAERDVSIRTGEAVVAALGDRGYDAWPLFVDRDVDMVLRQARIDVAFVALHGRYGEDGCIQGLLELLGIPYTGSPYQTLCVARNKPLTKHLLRGAGLPTADFFAVEDLPVPQCVLDWPVIVKPGTQDASVG